MKKIDLSKVHPRLLAAARATQRAAKHYGIEPSRMLVIDREDRDHNHARYAVFLHLHSHGWSVADISELFDLSYNGALKGIGNGRELLAKGDARFAACLTVVKRGG